MHICCLYCRPRQVVLPYSNCRICGGYSVEMVYPTYEEIVKKQEAEDEYYKRAMEYKEAEKKKLEEYKRKRKEDEARIERQTREYLEHCAKIEMLQRHRENIKIEEAKLGPEAVKRHRELSKRESEEKTFIRKIILLPNAIKNEIKIRV